MSRRCSLVINILINSGSESELSQTISSLLEQVAIENFETKIVIQDEKSLSKKYLNSLDELIKDSSLVRISNKEASEENFDYRLKLEAGDLLTSTFIYRGIQYLKRNPVAMIIPEYSIRFMLEGMYGLITRNKFLTLDKQGISLLNNHHTGEINRLFDIIEESAVVKKNYYGSTFEYLDIARRNKSFYLNNIELLPSDVKKIDVNKLNLIAGGYRDRHNLDWLKKLCGRSKVAHRIYDFVFQREQDPESLEIDEQIHTLAPDFNFWPSELLADELNKLAKLNYTINGYQSCHFFDNTFLLNRTATLLEGYVKCAKALSVDNYEYVLVLPWLINGGVDMFAKNYINTIAKENLDKKLLLIVTNPFEKTSEEQIKQLEKNIDFLNFAEILKHENYATWRKDILATIILNLKPKYLHIMMSKIGYQALIAHQDEIRKNTKIIFSSYNYIENPNGRLTGYSVEDLPKAYRAGDIITTDNQMSKDIWVKAFKFRENDIKIHRQLITNFKKFSPEYRPGEEFKIFWAAHIRKEKNPEILLDLIKKYHTEEASIDCYGSFNEAHWENGNPITNSVNKNLNYCGSYRNFFKDINLKKYHLFLYTSKFDGTPNVLIEAALSGIPIISSKIGGVAELLGNKAILIENPDNVAEFYAAIEEVKNNYEKYLRLATELQEKIIKQTSEENFIKQVKEMLNDNN